MTRPVAALLRSALSASAAAVERAVQSWLARIKGAATSAASPSCQLKASITTTIVSGVTEAETKGASRCAATPIACSKPRLAMTDTSPTRPAEYQPMGSRARWSPSRWYIPPSRVVPTRKPERSLTYRSTAYAATAAPNAISQGQASSGVLPNSARSTGTSRA
jgi:hypothetical protein